MDDEVKKMCGDRRTTTRVVRDVTWWFVRGVRSFVARSFATAFVRDGDRARRAACVRSSVGA